MFYDFSRCFEGKMGKTNLLLSVLCVVVLTGAAISQTIIKKRRKTVKSKGGASS
jgi:hypothetical protein